MIFGNYGNTSRGNTNRKNQVEKQFWKYNSENIIRDIQVENYNSEKTDRNNVNRKIQNGKYKSENKLGKKCELENTYQKKYKPKNRNN